MNIIKHTTGTTYTKDEIISMYGKEFFSPRIIRPIKQKIQKFSDFDSEHQNVYYSISIMLKSINDENTECWAFGSRVNGNWMTPQEDPRGKGSDWDILTTAKRLPNNNILNSFSLSNIRIDFRIANNIPPILFAIKIP